MSVDIGVAADIAAEAFYDDPLMSWVIPDDSTRLGLLRIAFIGLSNSFVGPTCVLDVVDDGCVAMWRAPDWVQPPDEGGDDDRESPFPADVQERFRILGELMEIAHPHDEPHWYLNVLGTRPSRQGQGLGARTLGPMCARFDAEGVPAYLESSNPRNMTLYRRQGFEEINEPIQMPDGPALYPMWRAPQPRR